jgi:ABC-type transport system involved in multi-copper enzyme maturation permease subunit
MGVWIMAGVTFREAARKKLLWVALLAGAAFLTLFATGMHFQHKSFESRAVAPFIRYQIVSGFLQVGFYAIDLLVVVITILTSVDTISGEISSGTIHAMATKPIGRWQILMGKWFGFTGMIAAYVSLLFAGVVAVGYFIGGVLPQNLIRGALLIILECLLVLSVTLLSGTWFSTLTNGVVVLGLHGLAFVGGWIEQIGGFTNSPRLVNLGIVASLIMPSECLWRRAIFEMQSAVAHSLPFGPFSQAIAPSLAMVGYGAAYLVVSLVLGIWHFQRRDL